MPISTIPVTFFVPIGYVTTAYTRRRNFFGPGELQTIRILNVSIISGELLVIFTKSLNRVNLNVQGCD